MSIEQSFARLGLPQVAQVGFVVRDLDASIASYDPLFGPFTRMDVAVESADYRGRTADCRLRIGFGHSGDVEIELIEWVSGESPHREFIEQGHEGMHHLQFRVNDLDAWVAKLERERYRIIWHKRLGEAAAAWAYLEREGDALILELLQMADSR